MGKLSEIITTLALIAFVLGMCTIESNLIGSLIMMIVSGAWLVYCGFAEDEKRRKKERGMYE